MLGCSWVTWNPNRTPWKDPGDGRGPAMLRAVSSLALGESGLKVAKHSIMSRHQESLAAMSHWCFSKSQA